jgi:hypothetical protein
MKPASTIRRELRRLAGIIQREGLDPAIKQRTERFHQALRWALDNKGSWFKPSECSGVRVRKGER